MTSGLLPKFYETTEAPTSTPPLSVEQVVSEFEVMDELLEENLAIGGNFTLEDSFEIDDSVDDDGSEDNYTSSEGNLGDGIITVTTPEDDKKKEKERKKKNHEDKKRSLYDYGDVRKRFLRSGE